MRKMIRSLFVLGIVTIVTACSTNVERHNFPDLTFTHLQRINLDVASIEVVQAYQPPLQQPHIEHETPISMLATTATWAEDVFKSVGQSGSAKIIISEASIVEEALSNNNSITSTFTTEQSEKYTSKLTVEIQIQDAFGGSATTNSSVSRSITVAEDISLTGRERVWFDLIEDTINDMNLKIRDGIGKYLKDYLR
ncbi:hypothetical protein [Curvivirga aplysinae]|uniref:hypothetical protein n=1 Tax=Curvivirga aplysinae TaxID=2529852 RepID=UPI0012BC5E4A|nr:hypothetical protein [Curvivirga aplysinae]MTI11225.1 hypothetical protein [Curvivirga aplysinae]